MKFMAEKRHKFIAKLAMFFITKNAIYKIEFNRDLKYRED